MRDILDVHTHTIASGHAYNTIYEMAKAASENEIELLGITEHAVNMPGTCHLFYFQNIHVLPRELYGVKMLFGSELNIVDYDGNVDMDESVLEKMDICIASMHMPCFKSGSIKENTDAIIRAMKNPYINVIGHPDDGRFPLDYERMVKAAKENHVLLELNNSSVAPNSFRSNSKENVLTMLSLCKDFDVPVIMNSDAHVACDVGNHKYVKELADQVNLPERLIVNQSVDMLMDFLK